MFYFLCYVKGLATVSLSTMRQSVKTLFLAMSYVVDMVVHLLKCLPNLENLFVQVMILTPDELIGTGSWNLSFIFSFHRS